mgnify:FL=1|jgi:hypothetical protein
MPKKLTFQYIKDIIDKEELLISTEYINSKEKLKIECKICKEIYNQTYDNYKKGHRHQKCANNLNSITALKKRYGEIFLKDTLRICEWCKEHYNPKRSEQKFCSQKCSTIHLCSDKEKLKINGRKGFEVRPINNRSKNEILCSELCIKYFGQNDIQCNEKIFKDTNGNFWDCDIFIISLKIAILWDGYYWHQGPNVSNKQKARDILKRKIIVDNGCEYYTIIDKGKFNKEFVEGQFNLFLHKLNFKKVLCDLMNC